MALTNIPLLTNFLTLNALCTIFCSIKLCIYIELVSLGNGCNDGYSERQTQFAQAAMHNFGCY